MDENPTNADEQYKLGYRYGHPRECEPGETFVPWDEKKEIYWYTKAAEQGHHQAIVRLAAYYQRKGDMMNFQMWSDRLTQYHVEEEVKKAKAEGCYVATCVYGSYDCQEVWTLRRYRDGRLSNSWIGRLFIRVYYAVSPKIVELFGSRKWFNGICKPLLNKIVHILQNRGIESRPYSDM